MDRKECFDRVLTLEPQRTALLIVDMQKGFMDPGEAMAVPPAWDIVPGIKDLADFCRQKAVPVLYTEYCYNQNIPILLGDLHPEHRRAVPGQPTGFGCPSSCCLEGEENVNTIPDLKPQPGEPVIRKYWYDAFNQTSLDGALRCQDIKSLVVTGIMTDICVFATIVGAFNREYKMVVVKDATATLWPNIQEATLDIIQRAYARVRTAKEVKDEINGWGKR
jgi:nicotinamidase-related amidase